MAVVRIVLLQNAALVGIYTDLVPTRLENVISAQRMGLTAAHENEK
jgi:hypothetical protein